MRAIVQTGARGPDLGPGPAGPSRRPPPPPDKTFTTSAEVAALMAQARSQVKPDVPTISQPLLLLAPYRASLEYRTGKGPGRRARDGGRAVLCDRRLGRGGAGRQADRREADQCAQPVRRRNRGRRIAQGGQGRRVHRAPGRAPSGWFRWTGALAVMTLHVPRP
ncbi:MAG: hypothetical protein WDN45_16390 [Caulobacteraceae bacterium]